MSRGTSKGPGEFGGDAMVDIVEFGWKPEGKLKTVGKKDNLWGTTQGKLWGKVWPPERH